MLTTPSPEVLFRLGMGASPHTLCPFSYPDLAEPWEEGKFLSACIAHVSQYGEMSPPQ